MTKEEAKSCIGTIEMLQRLAYNIHGVMDVIDADNCKKIIKALEQESTTKNDLVVDCISRADARSLICKIDLKHHISGISRKAFKDLYNGMDELPSVTPQEPRWIPVTEDAPPKGTICLWCNEQGSVFTSEITYRSECSSHVGKHGYFSNGLENYGNIVAWMPLPTPYEPQKSEDKE